MGPVYAYMIFIIRKFSHQISIWIIIIFIGIYLPRCELDLFSNNFGYPSVNIINVFTNIYKNTVWIRLLSLKTKNHELSPTTLPLSS